MEGSPPVAQHNGSQSCLAPALVVWLSISYTDVITPSTTTEYVATETCVDTPPNTPGAASRRCYNVYYAKVTYKDYVAERRVVGWQEEGAAQGTMWEYSPCLVINVKNWSCVCP